ncbi:phage antirepressor N-terminal domain-containing protein [Deinococcus sp. 6GRE01]|uniref:phage antirepressor N-terminal domain-containing protein n=1 Tax=Deinococcus sp. 6GRE01 TaxID=2745873 RepID=UPI001E2A7DBD|nr:phage antirepressor N-terminal domain-containing protein [Deinococcus sp. 6GRE01]MCD0155969.1 phage antirepressor KilAC domain-containing protein [Deinococcus sp. 6GRE01]
MTLSLQSNTQATIPFHGAQLLARIEGDDIYVAVKPICDHLGIAYQPQHKKLVEDGKFNCHHMSMTAQDGRQREMLVIERRDLMGWVYGISPKKVGQGKSEAERAALAGILLAYQRESTDALYQYWLDRLNPAPAPAPATPVALPALPATYSEALRALADVVDSKAVLAAENAVLQPKAQAFERLMDTDGTYSMNEAAKIIGKKDLGQNQLFDLLRARGILYRNAEGATVPYQQYLKAGYFTVRAGSRPSLSRGAVATSTTRVTVKGLNWICKNVLDIPVPQPRLAFEVPA